MKWIALIAVTLTGSLLLVGVGDFPEWGDAHSAANEGPKLESGEQIATAVSQSFLTDTDELTQVPNVVTAVLADYRGYDTMFETIVIFAAGLAIFAILRGFGGDEAKPMRAPEDDTFCEGDHSRIIIGTTCKLLIPIIQLFALYVIAHGHHSPGGGFQGGVIMGASFILLAIARDLKSALDWFSEKTFMRLASVGILIYAGFGVLCQFFERNFLDYGALKTVMFSSEQMARSYAMLGVEIGVAFTVTAIMFAIYANLSSRGELKQGL